MVSRVIDRLARFQYVDPSATPQTIPTQFGIPATHLGKYTALHGATPLEIALPTKIGPLFRLSTAGIVSGTPPLGMSIYLDMEGGSERATPFTVRSALCVFPSTPEIKSAMLSAILETRLRYPSRAIDWITDGRGTNSGHNLVGKKCAATVQTLLSSSHTAIRIG